MKTNFFKVLCATAIGLFGCSDDQNPIDKTTVNSLDLTRYMGKWYEIARYDHSFEHGLVGCTAHYTLQNDGTVKVVNAGYKNTLDGKYTETAGKARRPNAQV
ncbi:MAG: lipocalin family protein, partial [Bacteroidales bacterium]